MAAFERMLALIDASPRQGEGAGLRRAYAQTLLLPAHDETLKVPVNAGTVADA